MHLTADNVHAVTIDCLAGDTSITPLPGEPLIERDGDFIVEGVINKFAFKRTKIEQHRDDIESMLLQLPETFRASVGGGWSFLNACTTKDEDQWGEHIDVEKLIVLGMALGVVECQVPRPMWSVLPGGMPYYVVNL